MLSRRKFIQAVATLVTIYGGAAPWSSLAAKQNLTPVNLPDAKPCGNITIAHLTDIHTQLKPAGQSRSNMTYLKTLTSTQVRQKDIINKTGKGEQNHSKSFQQ